MRVLLRDNLPVFGVNYDEQAGIYKRMDLDTAQRIAKKTEFSKTSLYTHAREASGGRIRFSTDSGLLKLQAELMNWDVTYGAGMEAGKFGFDVYEDTEEGSFYLGTIAAQTPNEPGIVYVEGSLPLQKGCLHHLTIYFPLLCEVQDVRLFLDDDADMGAHGIPYVNEKPIVFYGNSVTQGGCAQRPGNAYVNRACRELNRDYLNLGMWGSAKGQPELAEYIAMLSMEACVLDYDGNQRKPEGLAATHYPFYDIIRQKHPKIPILMLTRSSNSIGPETALEMKKIIWETFQKACSNGDENAHFLDGEVFFGYDSAFFADRVHPNDRGHEKAGCLLVSVLKRIFSGEKNVCVLQRPISCE